MDIKVDGLSYDVVVMAVAKAATVASAAAPATAKAAAANLPTNISPYKRASSRMPFSFVLTVFKKNIYILDILPYNTLLVLLPYCSPVVPVLGDYTVTLY